MKKGSKILIPILCLILILSIFVVFIGLWIIAVAHSHLYLNIFLIALFIFSIFYMRKCKKKTRNLIIILEIFLILLYLFTFIINIVLINKHQTPIFYFVKTIYPDCVEYLCLYYAIAEVTVKLPDNSIRNEYILYSYQDRDLGTNIFPKYVTSKISHSEYLEYLEAKK